MNMQKSSENQLLEDASATIFGDYFYPIFDSENRRQFLTPCVFSLISVILS